MNTVFVEMTAPESTSPPQPDQDSCVLKLGRGTNRLLIEVSQAWSAWALVVRFEDADPERSFA